MRQQPGHAALCCSCCAAAVLSTCSCETLLRSACLLLAAAALPLLTAEPHMLLSSTRLGWRNVLLAMAGGTATGWCQVLQVAADAVATGVTSNGSHVGRDSTALPRSACSHCSMDPGVARAHVS